MTEATKCLANAINIIRESTVLDDVAKDAVIDPLRKIVESRTLSDAEMMARMSFELREASQRAYIEKVAMAQHEIHMNSTAGWSGRELGTAITPQWGNRGNKDVQALTSEITSQIRIEGAKLRPVLAVITDTSKGLIRNTPRSMEFVKAAEGVSLDKLTDRGAIEAARVYRDVLRPWLERLRKAGVWVQDIEHYFPHGHDIVKIRADMQNWKDFLVRHLDRERHPDPAATADAILATMSGARHDSPEVATITMARQVKFDAPEFASEYFFRYGNGSATDTVQKSLEVVVSRTLIAEKFGPRAALLVRKRAEEIKKSDELVISQNPDRRKEMERDIKHAQHAEDIMQSVTGALEQPRNVALADWSGTARNVVSALKLGKVVLASPGDFANSVWSARYHTGGLGSAISQQIKATFDMLSNEQARELAGNMGLWQHAAQANSMHRMGDAFDMSNPIAVDTEGVLKGHQKALGWSVQASSFTQRVTAAQALEQGMRSAFGLIGSRALRAHSRKTWEQLPERYRRVILENNSITKADWDAMRANAAPLQGVGGLDTTKLPPLVRQKFDTMLLREAEIAVVMPNTADRHWLTFGTQAGTFPGEGAAMMTQFLSWPLSFARNAMSREVQNGGVGVIGWAGGMVAFGVLQIQLYALASGEPMYPWSSPELWYKGLSRSAVLTPLWPMVEGIASGRGVGSSITPPVLDIFAGTFTDIAQAIDDGILEGNADEGLAEMLQAVEGLAPNFWFVQPIINQVIDYAMWELDPETMQREQSRLIEQGRE